MMNTHSLFLFYLLNFVFTSVSLFAATNIIGLNFQQEGEISNLIIRADGQLTYTKRHNKDQKTLILDIKDAVSSQKALRPIDTSEFPGAVVYISAYPKPDSPNDIRVAIQLRDNVNSNVEKVGNNLVLKIENRFGAFAQMDSSSSSFNLPEEGGGNPVVEGDPEYQQEELGLKVPRSNQVEDILDNLTLSGNKKYIGKKISVNVKGASVTDVLQMIAETSGFNIFLEDGVATKPPMTINLTDVPWDEALDTVLMINKLSASKYNNILTITTIEKALEAKSKKEEEEKKLKVQEPLVTKIFSINYARTQDIVTILNDYKTEERGKITVESRTNKLIVKDTATVIERMKKIIELIDTANPQVLIESKIVEVNESASKELGLDNSTFTYNPFSHFTAASDSPKPGFVFNTLGTGSMVNFSIDVFKRLKDVSLSLKLLESKSMAKIVSSPRVITQNNVAASITSSQSVPYRTSNVSNGVTTEAWNSASAAINLNVTPNVTNNGSIALNVSVNKSGFAGQAPQNGPPPTSSNAITTNVLVDNGATVVLGGLYKLEDSENHSGIPVLKDIPILGWFFRTKYNPLKTKSEMMVFITPSIMNQSEAGLGQSSEM
jgi:type IV pilus assembly protein PilQ